jgi:ribose transport system substrate-binding protein
MSRVPRSKILLLASTALAAVLATACSSQAPAAGGGGGSDDGTLVVGYSQSNNAEPYRAQLNLQLQHFMKKYPDMKLLPIADAHQDSTTQVSQVQQFISRKVDVLIISPNEPDPLTPVVEQACAAHIPVIILDRTVNTDCYSAFIGGDNYQAGQLAGKLALQQLPQGGNVVELRGILSNQPQVDRDKGFRDAIKSSPSVKIVADQEAKWLKPDATQVMQQWLQRYDDIDLVYAHNDPMALGAYLAAAGANREKDIDFIGTDGLAIPDGGIRAVQQGELTGTFIYPTGAEEAAKTANALAHGQTVPKKTTLDIQPVTKDNAAQLYQKYDFSKEQ